MMSSGPNSPALRRCLPVSAYSMCAHTPSDATVVPIRLANCPSPSLLSRLPAPLRLPIPPLGRIDHPTLLYCYPSFGQFPPPHPSPPASRPPPACRSLPSAASTTPRSSIPNFKLQL